MAHPSICLTEYSLNTRPLAHCVNLTWYAGGLLFLFIYEVEKALRRLICIRPDKPQTAPGTNLGAAAGLCGAVYLSMKCLINRMRGCLQSMDVLSVSDSDRKALWQLLNKMRNNPGSIDQTDTARFLHYDIEPRDQCGQLKGKQEMPIKLRATLLLL